MTEHQKCLEVYKYFTNTNTNITLEKFQFLYSFKYNEYLNSDSFRNFYANIRGISYKDEIRRIKAKRKDKEDYNDLYIGDNPIDKYIRTLKMEDIKLFFNEAGV